MPAFAYRRGLAVEVPGVGKVACDIAYGGAFYAILPARAFGLDLAASPLAALTQAAGALTDAIRAGMPVTHPDDPDLGFLYGTILTDDAAPHEESANICVFAERQVDRSPTGSGVTARMALDHQGADRGRRDEALPLHHRRRVHGQGAWPGERRAARRGDGRG